MTSNELTKLFQLLSGRISILPTPSDLRFRAVGGGSINAAFRVSTKDGRSWFCKINDTYRFPGLFDKEAAGLALLGKSSIFRVPAKIACESIEEHQILLLEWISEGARPEVFWRSFGEKLARLHLLSPALHYFGLDHSNYMGALPQDNTPADNFVDFFIHRRLMPQVALAVDKGYFDAAAVRQFERLYTHLPGIFPPEPPSLLHGDLWSGNFLADEEGQPVLIDPAVYFGHRSIDLAMTTLFGDFRQPFYDAYNYQYPFPANFRDQWEICNLYPLLVHLNLFGLSYLGNILHTIRRF
jgi:fructosamine-3-kinase